VIVFQVRRDYAHSLLVEADEVSFYTMVVVVVLEVVFQKDNSR